MPSCLSCGICCHFFADGKYHKCKYLDKHNNCKIYFRYNRIGIQIYKDKNGKKYQCRLRNEFKINYPDCPYNKDGQDMISEEEYNKIKVMKNGKIQD